LFEIVIIEGGQPSCILLQVFPHQKERSGVFLCITIRIDIVRVLHRTHRFLAVRVAATNVYVYFIGRVCDLAGLKTCKGTFAGRWTSCRRISMLLWGATTLWNLLLTAIVDPLEWCKLQRFPGTLYSSLLLHVWCQCSQFSQCSDSGIVSSKLM
jgi:hypothetical protein